MAITAPHEQGTKRLDWEAYLRWQDDLMHYEIIDGEVHPLLTPTLRRQLVQAQLMDCIRGYLTQNRLGVLLAAPFDFVVRREPLRTRQPDLFFLPSAREAEWRDRLNEPRLEIAPELAIELLSPSDTYQRWKEKLQDYHHLGVREVWAVDVEAGEIEVLVREEGGYRSLGWFSGEQPVPTQVLTGLTLTPAEVFAGVQESG
jgi:Uma2 family endonuclease